MRLYVHRNLNKKCWSLLRRGKLVRYRQKLLLHDVEFRVRPGGARRAQEEMRRNVHAFAIGDVGRGVIGNVVVRYNVWEGKFIDGEGRQVFGAEKAYFSDTGQVLAHRPFYSMRELNDRLHYSGRR